ncbi:S8 family serine peptidase, partial [Candidatus Woesearchaeota archaeon]|nr:S8 family serine peptidase [Candidatus Woesearchaeota archaeon]
MLAAFAASALAIADSEIDEFFGSGDEVSVIVVLKDDYNVLEEYGISSYTAQNSLEMKKLMVKEQQEEVLESLEVKEESGVSVASDEPYDIDVTNIYSTVNSFAGRITREGYQKLKDNPKVREIYKPKTVRAFLSDSKQITNATNVWKLVYAGMNITGKGETVCIIDTGVDYTHPALGGCFGAGCKVIGGYDFVNNDNDPIDDQGHGTHVAGIVASTNDPYTGIAPEANIVAIKVLDSTGSGSSENVINGIDWCVNNASKFNISVISMSLGAGSYANSTYCDTSDTATADVIHNAIARNISVVVAAGNDGSLTGVSDPACISNVTVVGSTDKANQMSPYNRWGLPMLVAPGSNITSAQNGGGFVTFSGTSMATPMIAGAFALLRQFKRLESGITLTPSQIQQKLNDTGKIIDDTGNSGLFYPRINILAALLSFDTTAPNITFSIPTESNSTRITANYTFINITSNEIISNATLEWNGTNETMEGNGMNWWKNKTNLNISSVPYTFKVWGNDSSGNAGVTESRILIFNNTKPL